MDTEMHEGSQTREAILVPDSVLPCQIADATFGATRLQPEKRLQLAVLEDAVITFQRTADRDDRRSRALFAETEAWFTSDAADDPFSFVTICDTLNLDCDFIRRGLTRVRAQPGNAQRSPFSFRRERSGGRHQVVQPRLRRIA